MHRGAACLHQDLGGAERLKGDLCLWSPSYSLVQKISFKRLASAVRRSRRWASALNITDKTSVLVELDSSGQEHADISPKECQVLGRLETPRERSHQPCVSCVSAVSAF